MIYDLIIVGAGAAGLFAAANAPEGRILLLEKMNSPGRKLLISGGGMCNLTNCDGPQDFVQRFGSRQKANFLKPSLFHLPPEKTVQWFEDRGLPLSKREDGKIFPRSLKAQSVVQFLVSEAGRRGVEVLLSSPVQSLSAHKGFFRLMVGEKEYRTENLLLTTGGKSFETTGSDGSGYAMARSLGHKIVEPTQALVPLFIEHYGLAELAGSSLRDISVDFFRDSEGSRYLQGRGDLLFTHRGVSGPVILNNSRFVRSGDRLNLCLIKGDNRDAIRTDLIKAFDSNLKKTAKSILKSFGIFSALSDHLLALCEIDSDSSCANLSKKKRNRLISRIIEYPMTVSRKGHFSGAMATAGGVSLDEVDRKTMESKKVPGLYFAGEVLDFDGDTGGYNIQAAFSTAFSALSAYETKDKQA